MQKAHRSLSFFIRLMLISGLIATGLPGAAGAASCSEIDHTGPAVSITSPTSTGAYETTADTITLSGEAMENCGLQMIRWSVDGQAGVQLASGQTDDWGVWSWQAKDIELAEGLNRIVVAAEDAAGNLGETSIDVTYTHFVPPPPPAGETGQLSPKQAKFTFYFGGEGYEDLDRFSVVSYLKKQADEKFMMPFDQDVTVTVHVSGIGEQEPIFSQTIPAGSVAGTSKYRYTSYSGVRDLTLMNATSTSVYMYVFVDKWNFLPELRNDLSPEAYRAKIQEIDSFTITLEMGSDKTWQGSAPLKVSIFNDHKQELHYNR
ncbi:MAG: hypothetical protein C4530_17195 [Desulfobacteraceae bacterium]|nr:MAG: hypothetical protein C4530_17195 [Desulfobacteraceae bacterium]